MFMHGIGTTFRTDSMQAVITVTGMCLKFLLLILRLVALACAV